LLCALGARQEVDGGHRYQVRDGEGESIGTIHRVPASARPFRHTWRIDQPGRPGVVGRNQWTSVDLGRAKRAAGKVLSGALDAVASVGEEGGDKPSRPRTLEWRADDELVMTSQGTRSVTIDVDWLDRRLAFAFALLGDR
jgi:hypothetical protein